MSGVTHTTPSAAAPQGAQNAAVTERNSCYDCCCNTAAKVAVAAAVTLVAIAALVLIPPPVIVASIIILGLGVGLYYSCFAPSVPYTTTTPVYVRPFGWSAAPLFVPTYEPAYRPYHAGWAHHGRGHTPVPSSRSFGVPHVAVGGGHVQAPAPRGNVPVSSSRFSSASHVPVGGGHANYVPAFSSPAATAYAAAPGVHVPVGTRT